jgi:hypothetical protein
MREKYVFSCCVLVTYSLGDESSAAGHRALRRKAAPLKGAAKERSREGLLRVLGF